MKKIVLGVLLCSWSLSALSEQCVVLLHGMARTELSMKKMAEELTKEGYSVVNYGYPSTSLDISQIAANHVPKAIFECKSATPIHFVTHSLGGIVLRKYLSTNELKILGRVVMLGPPNQGSEVVDTLKDFPGFKLINGPSGMQLGTGEGSVPNSLGPVSYPVGIIAGSSTINPVLSQMLPNPDDGKVSVERTKVEGMADHMVVPVSHPLLMQDADVKTQVKSFLKEGKFLRDDIQRDISG